MIEKKTRVIDLKLLEVIRGLNCLACGSSPCHPHHVTSRGAGGDDVPENLMPLCAIHHGEIHSYGIGTMAKKYPSIMYWLELAERSDIIDRLNRSKNEYDFEVSE